ncbi:hypothetical protein ACVMGC_006863 [Bradyrhizobium barranii subsp. barranii]
MTRWKPLWTLIPGSRLDADHPENGVLIPCRNTDEIEIDDNFSLKLGDDTPPPNNRLEAVAAVVGAAFDAAIGPDLRRKLRHGQALCAIVQVPTPAWAEPVAAYYRTSFGDRWIQRVNYGADLTEFQNRTGSTAVSLALAAGQSVVGFSADVGLLPQVLVGAADLLIRLAPPNAAVVKSAIARFAGRGSVEVEDSVIAELDLDDIVAAMRPGSGPQRIGQRLVVAAASLRIHRRTVGKETQPCSL